VKVELIGGTIGSLASLDSRLLALPTLANGRDADNLVATLAEMIDDHSKVKKV
jgi:hypothetical protein